MRNAFKKIQQERTIRPVRLKVIIVEVSHSLIFFSSHKLSDYHSHPLFNYFKKSISNRIFAHFRSKRCSIMDELYIIVIVNIYKSNTKHFKFLIPYRLSIFREVRLFLSGGTI